MAAVLTRNSPPTSSRPTIASRRALLLSPIQQGSVGPIRRISPPQRTGQASENQDSQQLLDHQQCELHQQPRSHQQFLAAGGKLHNSSIRQPLLPTQQASRDLHIRPGAASGPKKRVVHSGFLPCAAGSRPVAQRSGGSGTGGGLGSGSSRVPPVCGSKSFQESIPEASVVISVRMDAPSSPPPAARDVGTGNQGGWEGQPGTGGAVEAAVVDVEASHPQYDRLKVVVHRTVQDWGPTAGATRFSSPLGAGGAAGGKVRVAASGPIVPDRITPEGSTSAPPAGPAPPTAAAARGGPSGTGGGVGVGVGVGGGVTGGGAAVLSSVPSQSALLRSTSSISRSPSMCRSPSIRSGLSNQDLFSLASAPGTPAAPPLPASGLPSPSAMTPTHYHMSPNSSFNMHAPPGAAWPPPGHMGAHFSPFTTHNTHNTHSPSAFSHSHQTVFSPYTTGSPTPFSLPPSNYGSPGPGPGGGMSPRIPSSYSPRTPLAPSSHSTAYASTSAPAPASTRPPRGLPEAATQMLTPMFFMGALLFLWSFHYWQLPRWLIPRKPITFASGFEFAAIALLLFSLLLVARILLSSLAAAAAPVVGACFGPGGVCGGVVALPWRVLGAAFSPGGGGGGGGGTGSTR